MSAVPIAKKCRVIGCTKPAVARELCDMHRKRIARHGTEDDSVGRVVVEGLDNIRDHPLYEVWRTMTRSQRGTQVCDEWKDFRRFISDVGSKPDGAYRFVRIDATQKYSITNVRWDQSTNSADVKVAKAEYMRRYQRKLREHNPDYFKNMDLKKAYGISIDDYRSMLAEQGGVCAICKQPETRVVRRVVSRLHVDHCHTTHKVRGLLCHRCNTALGQFCDDETVLQSAIDYLRKHKRT
jgi:hypothetical protein